MAEEIWQDVQNTGLTINNGEDGEYVHLCMRVCA